MSIKSECLQINQWKKTYVINLDRRPDRIAKFQQRFPELCPKIIEDNTRISATDGRQLSELIDVHPELAERINYLKDRYQNQFVMGCAFSHWKTWNLISRDVTLADQDFVLIFEDDAEKNDQVNFISDLNKCLKDVKSYGAIDFLYIGGRPDKDFIPTKTIDDWKPVGRNLYIRPYNSRNSHEFDRCLYAYVITKAGAQKLINDSLDLFSFPVDHWVMLKFQKHQMKVLELFPHFCISPIEVDSDIITRENRVSLKSFLKQ